VVKKSNVFFVIFPQLPEGPVLTKEEKLKYLGAGSAFVPYYYERERRLL